MRCCAAARTAFRRHTRRSNPPLLTCLWEFLCPPAPNRRASQRAGIIPVLALPVGWDREFESAFLQRGVKCEPRFRAGVTEIGPDGRIRGGSRRHAYRRRPADAIARHRTAIARMATGWQGSALGAFWKPGDPAFISSCVNTVYAITPLRAKRSRTHFAILGEQPLPRARIEQFMMMARAMRLLGIDLQGASKRCRMQARQHSQRCDPLRPAIGNDPGEAAAPIMTDKMKPPIAVAHSCDNVIGIANQLVDPVVIEIGRIRTRTDCITTLVGSQRQGIPPPTIPGPGFPRNGVRHRTRAASAQAVPKHARQPSNQTSGREQFQFHACQSLSTPVEF
jgi:hypothetical protein